MSREVSYPTLTLPTGHDRAVTVVNDIADLAEQLTEPREHSERRHEWSPSRHQKPLEPHRTTVPGLIEQLRQMAQPGADGEPGGRGGPESCPANIDAVSLLASISHGAAWRCHSHGVTVRDTPEACIRGLVGVAASLGAETQHEIRAELRAWTSQAEIITGWKTPARELPAPCLHCGARGTLLARADPAIEAWCIGCRARWDEATIGILSQHVLDYRVQADEAARLARTRAVEDRRRREGAPR